VSIMHRVFGKYRGIMEGDALIRERPKRDQRVRINKALPTPAESATALWGRDVPELKGVTDVMLTRLLMDHPCFKETVGRKLDEIDHRNMTGYGKRTGKKPIWSAWELETVLVFGRMSGANDVKEALKNIRAEEKQPEILGFPDRKHPSEATVTRYRQRFFKQGERIELYLELDRQLRDLVTSLPGFDEEARILAMDGSEQLTRRQPPPTANSKYPVFKITVPDAAFGGGKGNKGWQLIALLTERWTPVAWAVTPLNEPESDVGARVLKSYSEHVMPKRNPEKISICSCDSGFKGSTMHRALLDANVVPNIPKSSHKTESASAVEKKETNWTPLHHPNPNKSHYMKWMMNELEELVCKCGKNSIEKITKKGSGGKLTVGTRGSCKHGCGTVTVISGKWRRAQNPDRVTPVLKGSQGGEYEPDYAIGNPFHFHDPLAGIYGRGRFNWNESFHNALGSRFNMLTDKGNLMRYTSEPVTEFAIIFSAISVLLLHRDSKLNQTATPGPPPSIGNQPTSVATLRPSLSFTQTGIFETNLETAKKPITATRAIKRRTATRSRTMTIT